MRVGFLRMVQFAMFGVVCAGLPAQIGCQSGPSIDQEWRTSLLLHLPSADLSQTGAEAEPIQTAVIAVGGVERTAILAHAPSAIRFPTRSIPEGARLTFGYGVDDRVGAGTTGVGFSVVLVSDGQEPETIWDFALAADADRAWRDVEVDLSAYGGRQAGIVLVTTDRGDLRGDWSAWSSPVLSAPRDPAAPAPAQSLVERRTVLGRDLLDGVESLPPSEQSPARGSDQHCRTRSTFVVPENGAVELAVQVLRDQSGGRGSLGPVALALHVDGETIYRRTLRTALSEITVSANVSLAAFSGREIDLDFEVCDFGRKNTLMWARRLWLVQNAPRSVPRDPEARNLLVLMVDTLRADRLGLYGHDRPTSPALDRFAQQARVFERAVSQSSWTQPAIASVMTGLSPIEHGVIEGVPLFTQQRTLAERAAEVGMATLGISSNPIVGSLEGFDRGFETFTQIPWARAAPINSLFWDWLGEGHDRPWFAYLHYVDPHSTYDAPGDWNARFDDGCATEFATAAGLDALSETINFKRGDAEFTEADIDCLSDRYDAEIAYWDAQFDALVQRLSDEGRLDNTIVVVVADHGEEFLEHGMFMHGYQLYDELIHVPLLISAPGRLAAERVTSPVQTQDLREALLTLLDAGDEDSVGGPLLDSELETLQFSHTTEAWVEDRGYTVLAAVGDERWKYILRPHDGMERLYDHRADPEERNDLSGSEPETLAHYRGLLEGWLSGARPHTMQIRGMDEETRDKLRALGYIR